MSPTADSATYAAREGSRLGCCGCKLEVGGRFFRCLAKLPLLTRSECVSLELLSDMKEASTVVKKHYSCKE